MSYGTSFCPRCSCQSLEHLQEHCFCWECGYAPELQCTPSKSQSLLALEKDISQELSHSERQLSELLKRGLTKAQEERIRSYRSSEAENV